MSKRFPSKEDSLRFLRGGGLSISTVIDVGVQFETPALRTVFPDIKHVLVEPIQEYHEAIRSNYASIDFDLLGVALSDRDGEGTLAALSIDGSGQVTHSYLCDDGSNLSSLSTPTENRQVTICRLDTLLQRRQYPSPYLLKIDTDGNELAVLRGAVGCLNTIGCIVVEAPINLIRERIDFLDDLGYRLWDIVDECQYVGHLNQVDLVFLSSNQLERAAFDPWRKPFQAGGWYELERPHV